MSLSSAMIKEAVMALFEPTADVEPDLPVAPDVSIEIIICPHCEQNNCEVWDSTEARMATCQDCGAQFPTFISESHAKTVLLQINEKRSRFRHGVVSSESIGSDKVKAEIDYLFRR